MTFLIKISNSERQYLSLLLTYAHHRRTSLIQTVYDHYIINFVDPDKEKCAILNNELLQGPAKTFIWSIVFSYSEENTKLFFLCTLWSHFEVEWVLHSSIKQLQRFEAVGT